MITRIEARTYKCLRDVDVELGRLNVLVGPNATGKSTLLDVVGFLRDALRLDGDVGRAVRARGRSLRELVWREGTDGFELALGVRRGSGSTGETEPGALRYGVLLGAGSDGPLEVSWEMVYRRDGEQRDPGADDWRVRLKGIFDGVPPDELLEALIHAGVLVLRGQGSNVFFGREGNALPYRPAPDRLALSLVPEDPDEYAEAIGLRDFLRYRVHTVELDPRVMRAPCPPDAPLAYEPDGSNVPLLVQQIAETERFEWWIEHLRLVMRGLQALEVVEEPHNRHLYLVAVYEDGLRVPAWRLSDGTLRFLALTLIAYLPPEDRVFIIEEPENGMHPKAIEYLMQSLTSVYEGQVFLATHSPIIVGLTDPEDLLCFSQDEEGATRIVRGSEHPELAKWREALALSDMFAAGVLG
jgi:predicted ATPase